MTHTHRIQIMSRRDVTVGSGAFALVAALLGMPRQGLAAEAAVPTAGPAPGSAATAAHSPQYDAALQAILKGATADQGPLTIELPDLAENGNVVPYSIACESPMTDEDYIKTLHLLSTSNPQALVATFHLIPATGRARVSGRLRLARSQDVVAIAEHSSGAFHVAVRKVDVTIGGCGGE